MAEADKPDYANRPGPPPEASRFLKNKGMLPAFDWAEVEPIEHAVAFTVAKATQIDVLTSIRDAVQVALDDGETFETFKKNLTPKLKKLGWWEPEGAIGEDGEPVKNPLGSPRRLKTIYDANLRSARAAGQWERIERTKSSFPYLLYQLGPSENHRPHHAAKEGLVLHVDDPFWRRWYPPNGWLCKCWVRQITKAEAERRGIDPSPEIELREWENPATGQTRDVPVGIDPGWDANPGAYRLRRMEDFLVGKLADAPEVVARAVLKDIASSWRVQRVMDGVDGWVPVGILPPGGQAQMGQQMFLGVNNQTKVHLVDEKLGQDRSRYLDGLAHLPEAEEAYIKYSVNDLPSYHFMIPNAARRSGSRRHISLVVWLDDAGRPFVRTVFPTTKQAFLRKQRDSGGVPFEPF